jgi:hypothetical protein
MIDYNKNLRDLYNEKSFAFLNYIDCVDDFCIFFDKVYGLKLEALDGSLVEFVEGYTGEEDGSREISFLIKYTEKSGEFCFFNVKGYYSSWDNSSYSPEKSYPLKYSGKQTKMMTRNVYLSMNNTEVYKGEWKELSKTENKQLELFNEDSWDDEDTSGDSSSWQ